MLCNGSTSRSPFYCHWTLSAFPSKWPRGWTETPKKRKMTKISNKNKWTLLCTPNVLVVTLLFWRKKTNHWDLQKEQQNVYFNVLILSILCFRRHKTTIGTVDHIWQSYVDHYRYSPYRVKFVNTGRMMIYNLGEFLINFCFLGKTVHFVQVKRSRLPAADRPQKPKNHRSQKSSPRQYDNLHTRINILIICGPVPCDEVTFTVKLSLTAVDKCDNFQSPI